MFLLYDQQYTAFNITQLMFFHKNVHLGSQIYWRNRWNAEIGNPFHEE